MSLNDQPLSNGSAVPQAATESAPAGPETSGTQQEQRRSPSDQISAISDLLKGGDDDADQGTDAGAGDNRPAADDNGSSQQQGEAAAPADADTGNASEPLTVKALAEKLDMEPAELYNELQVPISDGEAVSITKLQDSYRDRASSEQAIATKTDEISSREAGLVTDIQALGVLHAMQSLPQPILQQANGHLTEMAEREYQNFLTLHPDLQEDGNRIAFEKGMDEQLAKYGLSSAHFGVKNVGMYRFMRDVLKDRAELKRLKTPKAKDAPQSVKSQRAHGKKPPPIARGSKGRKAELAQINSLMGK